VDQTIGIIPANVGVGRHAKGIVEVEPEAAHDLVQRRVRTYTCAAAREVLAGALEHIDFPANAAEHVCSEQAAD
jgi:hypothetical protein